MRSLKAYLLPRLWPSTMCASSCESTIARLASSGSTSINPRLMTMVLPTLKVSSGEVSSTRVRTGRGRSILLVTSRLLTTVCRILSTSPSGASKPALLQALDYVVFRLLLPFALGLQRGSVLRGGALVLSRCRPGSGSVRHPCRPSSGHSPRCGSAP